MSNEYNIEHGVKVQGADALGAMEFAVTSRVALKRRLRNRYLKPERISAIRATYRPARRDDFIRESILTILFNR